MLLQRLRATNSHRRWCRPCQLSEDRLSGTDGFKLLKLVSNELDNGQGDGDCVGDI